MSADSRDTSGERAASLLGPRLVAGVLIALGILIFYETLQVRSPQGFSPIGPRFVPLVVSVGLVALGLTLLVRTTLRPDRALAVRCGEQEAAAHWPTVGLIGAVLIGYAVVLAPLGYLVATALFVPLAARVLGSTHPVRDVVTGSALALVIYFGFTEFLGVRLPAGILDAVL